MKSFLGGIIALACLILIPIFVILSFINFRILSKENKPNQYLYTITAPNLGTWQTTNNLIFDEYHGLHSVIFIIDNQEIRVTKPFVITKELYAPTNFIADDE